MSGAGFPHHILFALIFALVESFKTRYIIHNKTVRGADNDAGSKANRVATLLFNLAARDSAPCTITLIKTWRQRRALKNIHVKRIVQSGRT